MKLHLWLILVSLITLNFLFAENNKINELVTKMENYYNTNNIAEFEKTLDLATKYSINNNLNKQLIELIKQKLLTKNYLNPLLKEKIADSLFNLGDLKLSKNLYEELTKYINPNNELSSSILARIYFKISQIELLEGSLQKYLDYLNKSYIYENNPENKVNLKTQIIKDEINYLNIDQDKVIEELYELLNQLKLLPNDKKEKVYISIAEIYQALKLNEKAELVIEKIISKYGSLDSLLAQLYYEKDPQKKKEILLKIVREYQNIDPYYIEELADMYLREGNLQKAKELYIKVINQMPTKHEALYKLAQIFFTEKNIQSAQKFIDLAIKQVDNPQYFELAGDIYKEIDKNKAQELYQKAYELYQDISQKAKVRIKINELKDNK
ncbi:MAG: tetratricopeptide repeat protein [Candidatus Calescibacterium sp.]|nr:tetratricopeptide repeat protein [Candidatus Calescibacterium sp.]MDW8195753.1 tetratricopeptide repeat protein [Candidatus Calescibacterium sp.]